MADQDPKPEEALEANAEGASSGQTDESGDAEVADEHPSPEEAIDAAERAAETIKRETGDEDAESEAGESSSEGEPLKLQDFASSESHDPAVPAGLNLLDDIDLQVTIELGRTRMYIEDVLRLNEDSVVELDKAAGDSVDIYVNERLVARGEVLVLNENFCVRINEIISQQTLDNCEAMVGDHARR